MKEGARHRMGNGKKFFVLCHCGIVPLLVLSGAQAQIGEESFPRDREARKVVFLVSTDQAEVGEGISEAILAQLADMDVDFSVVHSKELGENVEKQIATAAQVSSEYHASLVVWCDLKEADRVLLLLADPTGTRIVKRRVDTESDGTSGRYEAVAVIVRSTMEAMALELLSRRVGKTAEKEEKPASRAEKETPKPPRAVYPFVRLSYAVSGFASQKPIVHSGEIYLGLNLFDHFGIVAGYGLTPFVKKERQGVELKLNRHAVKLGGRLDGPVGPVLLGGGVLAVAQFVDWQSTARSAQLQSAGGGVDVVYGFEAFLALGYEINKWFKVDTGPGVLALVRNSDYSMRVSGTDVLVLAPWRLQPFWFVSFCLRVPS